MYKKTLLKNGLRVITVPMENANSVTVLVLVGAGSKYETKDINGISHFLEHMFFKGTKKRPNTLKISETLDMVGGEYNAFTSQEITGFWARVSKRRLDIALDWISDIFLNSKFEQEEIDKEKGVIIEEINMYLDTPTAHIGDLWDELLYGDQPAGRKVIGTKGNILSFDRKKIENYLRSHYSPKNTVVCVAGGMESGVKQKIEDYFNAFKASDVKPKDKVNERQSAPEILLYDKKTDQTHLCLGVRAYNLADKRRYALVLLSIILGGNMSSRLFIEVRERNGLAYSIHTSTNSSTDVGYLVTQAGIDHKNLEKAVKLILQEYKDLKDKKITQAELQKAKDYLKGSMSLSLDASDRQASFYAVQELLEKNVLTVDEKFKKIDEVTIDNIKSVAEDIFKPEKLNLAVIGPIKTKEKARIKKLLIL